MRSLTVLLTKGDKRMSMSKSKFSKGDWAIYNGSKVKVASVKRELSYGTANGNLYYRIRKPKSTKSFACVRSDRLSRA